MHVGRGNFETNYFMNNQVLSKTEKERDIGVIIHKSLKPSLQCKEAARKEKWSFDQNCTVLSLQSQKNLLKPVFNLCQTLYCILVLENVHKRAVTMISVLYSNNYEDRLKELRMLSLKDRWIQFDMVQTFKIVREIDRVDRSLV